MKVFLTGSTGQYRILSPVGFSLRRLLLGNIGSGVLEACLRDPTVTAIVALSRRPLEVEDPKLKVIINDDFSTYSEEVLEEALSSDGAIWLVMFFLISLLEYIKVITVCNRCLGVLSHQDKTQEEKLRITKGSITAFLEAFIPKLLASPPRGSPWRLVWLGGMIVVRDQNASVWILSHIRKEFVSRSLL